MDVSEFREVRFFRVVSHNGNSSSLHGEPSASNFCVVLGDDISKVGELAAFSLENITFPNVFPNIRSVNRNNELLVRLDTPADDQLILFEFDEFSFRDSTGLLHTVVVPANILQSTANVVPFFNTLMAPFITASFDEFGAVFFTSNIGPITLVSNQWMITWGIPEEQFVLTTDNWVGYPTGAGYVGNPVFYTLTIAEGFFDQSQIRLFIETQLNDIVGDNTFQVDIVTIGADMVFRVQNAVHNFMFSPRSPYPGGPINYRQLIYQLGFQDVLPVLTDNFQANLNPALQGEQVVYLFSTSFASSKKSYSGEGPQDDMIATIPIWAGYGEINSYSLNQWNSPAISYDKGVVPRQFDFSLKNQFNEFLDIGWNQTLSVSFRLFFR